MRRKGLGQADRHREGAAGREERLLPGGTAEPGAAGRADRRRAGPRERADADRRLLRRGHAEPTTAIIAQETNGRPFGIESLRPIQMSKSDVLDAADAGREAFTTQEWMDFLIRSIGLEPAALSRPGQEVVLLRMVPFVERNYNLVELGPRGTGKSHLFQQISPYCAPDLRRQGDGREDVREQRHRPARAGLPVRRGLLR